ncbi:MAG: PAS domain S-box protein [Phyllobacteriaceae bacterium]|nr:PAS domain S-box protein [Phyllobacteriaceae bacterium]
MDADRRFTLVSDELAAVVGPAAADLVGRRWDEVAAAYDLDRDGVVAAALSRHDTWSGRTVPWPIEGEALRLPVDLAALPAFDRGRTFAGFRGFGTCRADPPVPDPTGVGRRLATSAAPDGATTDHPAQPDESELEPPLFPADEESARIVSEPPIDAAFAGDLGDDPILPTATGVPAALEPEPEPAPTEPVASAPLETARQPEPPPAAAPADRRVSETTAARRPRDAHPPVRVVGPDELARLPQDSTRLSVPERLAFRQIAEALGARIEGEAATEPDRSTGSAEAAALLAAPPTRTTSPTVATPSPSVSPVETATPPSFDPRLLDRLPIAAALLRADTLLHANERFLTLLHYPDVATLRAAGGADALFAGPHVARRFETGTDHVTPVIARDGTVVPCDASIVTVPVDGTGAVMLTLNERRPAEAAAPVEAAPALTAAERDRIAELEAIVDTATDGVLILDGSGLVLSANAAAEALFGIGRRGMIGRPLTDRLAPESRRSAIDYLDGLAANGVASVLNDGREVIGVVAPEGLIPLFMTIGRVSSGPFARYCAVLRDITQWKRSEEELTSARRRAEEASIHKSDFLAKISHEIRTPLNAIIGFSELMLDERFGPIGSDRYKDYLRDIHVSGSHIMSLVNDLLDLSKVEAGKMDLRFEAVPLADVISESVALMQPQANRERIIIRSSLPAGIPPVVADARSMRQVVLNLLSNAVKFTPAGGQVIVSITLEDSGEVVLRVRDTGYGMSEKELQTAMEPFRQLHTTRSRAGGTGLGLPLTKALVEANRATFRIDSTVGQGTLVSIAFPVTRVLAG